MGGGQQDRVRGITRVKKVCTTIRAKDCRIIPDSIERSIQTERCFSKPLRQTFTYTRKMCQLAPTQKQRPETWLNEKLHKVYIEKITVLFMSDINYFVMH